MPLSPVEEEVDGVEDAEWDDFDRLLAEYKVRRRNVPPSPVLTRRYLEQRQESAFYPCPPSATPQDPLDPYSEYVPSDSGPVTARAGPVSATPTFYRKIWLTYMKVVE
ncbi:hypothetical protein J6590_034524 [Homalodisca vitripennis]|nr:hypothetical protein J6590_034524 [Homalodisca vitripennis]